MNLKIIILLIGFSNSILFGQDSLKIKKKERTTFHCAGGGVELVANRAAGNGAYPREIIYDNPFFSCFYRFIIAPKKINGKMCLTLNGDYRHGSGLYYSDSGSFGPSDSYGGNFYSTRLDLGFTYLLSMGKRKNFSIGWGGSAGIRSLRTAVVFNTYDYRSSNRTSLQININMEMQYRIKIINETGILIGGKVMICTPDGFGFIFTTAVYPFLAIVF